MVAAQLGAWSLGRGPLYRQLATGVEALVRTGVVREGDRLPAERTLAAELSVSRGTVVAAYDLLRADGTVERVRGSGTRVAAGARGVPAVAVAAAGAPLFHVQPDTIDLLKAVPPASNRVRDIVTSVDLHQHEAAWESVEPAGLPELREAIARRCALGGQPTSPEQVLVTGGAQQAIALVVQQLVSRGDVVVSEAATWPGLVDLVRRHGGRVHGVAMDRDGVVVDELAAAVERLRPAMIALNPHHHNPTGTRLSPERRRRVADIAADFGVPLVEDRVAALLAFDGVVPPPLAVHRPDGVHVTIDALSKTAWGGLRIGWVRADAATVQHLRLSRALADLWSPVPSQVMALALIEHLDDIVRERVAELRRRERVLSAAVAQHLPEWEVDRARGGMLLWARLPSGSSTAFCRFAARFGVAVAGGREFSSSTLVDDRVRLPFTLPEATMEAAVERLAAAWAAFPDARLDEPLTPRAIV